MKKTLNLRLLFVCLLTATAPMGALAQTTFFSDNFSGSSTLNSTPTTSSPGAASYQTEVGSVGGTANIATGNFTNTFPSSSGVLGESLALFTNNPVGLANTGDFISIQVTFVSSNLLSGLDTANSSINIGLFNSGGVAPNRGPVVLTSTTNVLTGGTLGWVGYIGRLFFGGSSTIITRPAQTPSTGTAQDQDVLFSGASGSQAFIDPKGAAVGGNTASSLTLTNNGIYTVLFVIKLTAANTYTISNALYNGTGTATAPFFSQIQSASGATFVTTAFDGMAIGWRNTGGTQVSAMDITSILINGQSTAATGPPTITLQPVPTVIATGGAGAFLVTASGLNVTYQWHRNGTNLTDGGNISGSTTPTLLISPAGAGDVLSGANGYWVAVTGSGPFTTNSVTNSLSLITPTNLVWSGSAGTWDVNNTVAWVDTNGNPSVFNYGDPVTFDNTVGGGIRAVSLSGSFLSASSVTVDGTLKYTFETSSGGSFAGPGTLLVKNSNQLDIKNANTYTGGTTISNSTADVIVENSGGLGTGPVTLAKAGGMLEMTVVSSASSGVGGVNVADNFTIQFDGTGTFSGVFLGNFSGTVGKTLSFEPTPDNTGPFTNSRVRIYGTNTVYNANLFIDGPATSQAQYSGMVMAPYNSTGFQTYNGVISGNGGLIQRGSATTILAGPNTYSGGTTPTDGTIGFGIDTVGSVTSGPIGTGPLNLAPEVPNLTASGTVFASGGARTIANPIQYPSGTNNLLFIIAGTNDLTFTGTYILSGVDGLGTPTNRTIQVNNTNGLTTISGVISDGGLGYGFIKAGVGKLAFGNTETYTGPTLINGGTLAVNGSLNAASTVTATNGVLGGTGTIGGPVTIKNGGGIAPGNSIGTLTINNSLTIQGGSTNNFEVSKTGGTHDLVTGLTSVTYGGTLFATNLAGTITTSDTFQIFSTAAHSGNFTNIIGSPGAGLAWTFNTNNGTLGVVATINPNPPVVQVSITGSQLNLSWPTNLGWHLLMQTNSITVGLSTNWQEVVGATLVTSTNFQTTNSGAVFFKMTN